MWPIRNCLYNKPKFRRYFLDEVEVWEQNKGMNLTKEMKDPYNGNNKTLGK